MEKAGSQLGRSLPRILLVFVPAVAASALAVFVLTSVRQAPDPAERATNGIGADDNLTAEERRELTRQMLKARRENPETPAEVTPTARPAPAKTTGTAEVAPPPAAPVVATPVPRPPRPKAEPKTAAAPPAVPPPAAPAPAIIATTLPPPAQPGAPPVPANPAVRLPPVDVNVAAPDGAEPAPRSFASNVFSSVSTFAGTAANATGNGINWMIALPGKAISAGGKLITGGDQAPAATAPPPAPADQPPPKAKLL
jgi:hypothetical protein